MNLKDKRSLRALKRLKLQLKKGVKPQKKNGSPLVLQKYILLEERDTQRIAKEIGILETKLKPYLHEE